MNKGSRNRRVDKNNVMLAILLLALLVLAACTRSTDADVKDETYARTEPATGRKELILAIGSEPEEGFDPTTGWGRYGSPLFQSTLFKRDSEMNIVNDLATGYEVDDEGKVWTVTLRGDVVFSDGVPLTAEDVQFTFETAAKSGSVVDLTDLERVEAVDEHTVRFVLKRPNSTFVSILAATGIVPKHAYGDDYSRHPVGSGPYRLVQWDRGQQLIVEANPLYYGEKPPFDKLTFLFMDEDTAFAAVRAGQVDMAQVPAAFARQNIAGYRLVNLRTVDNRGIMFPYVKAGEVEREDSYPVGNDVTADIAIRKAVNVAIDRNKLVEGVLEGFGTPAYTSVDGLPWWNEESVIEDGDPARAIEILAQGGWSLASDGIMEKDGRRAEFTLLYPASDLTRQSLALAVKDMVRPAGIHIHVEGKSWDELRKMMHAHAVLFGWGSLDPLEMYHLHAGTMKGIDYFNPGYYENPVVDAWMEKALTARTEQEAIPYWKKAQWDGEHGLSARGDAPWAWLVNIDHLYFVRENLDIGRPHIQPHGHGWPVTDNIGEWKWID